MKEQDYRAYKGLNQSVLKLMVKSPANAKAAFEGMNSKDSPALRMGRALHSHVLEGKKEYFGLPASIRFNSQEAKSIIAQKKMENSNMIAFSSADYLTLSGMVSSVFANPDAVDLLELDGDIEKTLIWEENGLTMKARLDKIIPGIGVIDLKSTDNAESWGFSASIFKWYYHMQAAHYLSGCRHCGIDVPNSFLFIAVEKQKPYYSAVYSLDSAALEEGEAERQRLIALWKKCMADDYWPAYARGIKPISIPRYGFKNIIPSRS